MTNDNLTLEELDIAESLLQGYEALGRWEGANLHAAYSHNGDRSTIRRASTARVGAHATLAAFFAALSTASAQKDPIAAWVLNRALRGPDDPTDTPREG